MVLDQCAQIIITFIKCFDLYNSILFSFLMLCRILNFFKSINHRPTTFSHKLRSDRIILYNKSTTNATQSQSVRKSTRALDLWQETVLSIVSTPFFFSVALTFVNSLLITTYLCWIKRFFYSSQIPFFQFSFSFFLFFCQRQQRK